MTRIASFPQRAGFQPILPRPAAAAASSHGNALQEHDCFSWSGLFARVPKDPGGRISSRHGGLFRKRTSHRFFGSMSPASSPSYTFARFQTSYNNTHMLHVLWPKNRVLQGLADWLCHSCLCICFYLPWWP